MTVMQCSAVSGGALVVVRVVVAAVAVVGGIRGRVVVAVVQVGL